MRERFTQVTLEAKANVYFDGRCMSHTFFLADGTRKSAGVILPSTLTFTTDQAEIMEVIAGRGRVRVDGESDWRDYQAGETFSVPGRSGFDIEVAGEPLHYICHYAG